MQRIDHHLHRIAIVLAEELDFERAAQRLQITLPKLKKQIAQLERKLSLTLFIVDTDKVLLTELGQRYIELLRKSRLV